MKRPVLYNESERQFIREFLDTIVAANYETAMTVHLLWKLAIKAIKKLAKVTKCYVRKARVKQS